MRKKLNSEQQQERAVKIVKAWSNRITRKDGYTLLADLDLNSVHQTLFEVANIAGWEKQGELAMYYLECEANKRSELR